MGLRGKPGIGLAIALAVAALALPGNAGGTVSVGHSGWEWANPLPQGNTLRSLDFIGPVGYAAGDFGTLLRTDDGGSSWRGLATGTTEDLERVQTIDADSLVVAGGCSVRRSDDGGLSFRSLSWTRDRCRSPVASVAFAPSEVGYVLAEDGALYRSEDAGETWLRITPIPRTEQTGGEARATDLSFVAADVGLATTTDGIYRTSDSGFTWALVARDASGLEAVAFADERIGYAVGPNSTVLKSSDSGLTWAPKRLGVPGDPSLDSIRCTSALVCMATIRGEGRIVLTSDGGGTWAAVQAAPAPLGDGAFASTARAVAVGAGGITSTSDDGGESWAAVGGTVPGSFDRLRGRSGTLAFALGAHGALARTMDDGRSWSMVGLPTSEDIVDVSFPDQFNGFVLDGAGLLLRTEDGGATWTETYSDPSGQAQALLALDSNRVLLAGPRGIRRSLDGGLTFSRVQRPAVRRATLFDVDYAGGSLFAYGPTALFASRDGGRRWTKLRRPDHRPLAVVDFVGARIGFALGKGGRVWRTSDRGRTWRELLGTGTDGGIALAFADARNGYLAARDLFFAKGADRPDYVLHTSNGGQTWRPQLLSGSRDVSGLLARKNATGLLLAGRNLLFSTTTGGDAGDRTSIRLSSAVRRARPGRKVRLQGRLRPAEGGEQLIVSMTSVDPRHRKGAIDWAFKSATVARNGRFSVTWRIRRTSVFVAQWAGEPGRMSAGSKVLRVRVVRG